MKSKVKSNRLLTKNLDPSNAIHSDSSSSEANQRSPDSQNGRVAKKNFIKIGSCTFLGVQRSLEIIGPFQKSLNNSISSPRLPKNQ